MNAIAFPGSGADAAGDGGAASGAAALSARFGGCAVDGRAGLLADNFADLAAELGLPTTLQEVIRRCTGHCHRAHARERGHGRAGRAAGLKRLPDCAGCIVPKCVTPPCAPQVGVGPADVSRLAADAVKQVRLLPNNPRPVSEDDARALYQLAL